MFGIPKSILVAIVTGLIGIWQALVTAGVAIPAIPAWILTVLAALGLYGLRDAIKKNDVKVDDLKNALRPFNN